MIHRVERLTSCSGDRSSSSLNPSQTRFSRCCFLDEFLKPWGKPRNRICGFRLRAVKCAGCTLSVSTSHSGQSADKRCVLELSASLLPTRTDLHDRTCQHSASHGKDGAEGIASKLLRQKTNGKDPGDQDHCSRLLQESKSRI